MRRKLDPRVDALFVEGTDDGAFINALVKARLNIDLATRPYLVRTREDGGGDTWALAEFDNYVARAPAHARVGLVVDRDSNENDKWHPVRERLAKLGLRADQPSVDGAIAQSRFGIWLWPDNVRHGDLETVLEEIIPKSPLLDHARDASRVAKMSHGAEYEEKDERKATLKIRSLWLNASRAGGYGHLIRELPMTETPASKAFLDWFSRLFLTE